jgi:hypothetical protein
MEIDYINENAEGAVVLDGFNDAIIGIVEEFGNGPRVLYSKRKIIDMLCKDMELNDAEEYYNFNILGLYAGEQNAIFLVSE